jgi:hypothetical protein
VKLTYFHFCTIYRLISGVSKADNMRGTLKLCFKGAHEKAFPVPRFYGRGSVFDINGNAH